MSVEILGVEMGKAQSPGPEKRMKSDVISG
jgi:hypothetical protein